MPTTVDTKTIEAMLQRGRIRMVDAYIHEGGLINPDEMHTYWRGFAGCAKALLDGSAEVMRSHDEASDVQGVVQAAFTRLPNNLERLTRADMKRHMWAKGIDCAADLLTRGNVDAVPQLRTLWAPPSNKMTNMPLRRLMCRMVALCIWTPLVLKPAL